MIRSMGMFKSSSTNNKPKIQCKKHPKHRQSPGVCSLCLTEKLKRVSTIDNSRYALTYKAKARVYYYCSSSSVSSSDDDEDSNNDYYYYYNHNDNDYDYDENDEDDDDSSCTSSPESPVHGHHRRIVSDVNKYFANDRRWNRFDKSSRSMAVANNNKSGTIRSNKKEKKRVLATNNIIGFWSKLVGTRKSSKHVNHVEMIYRSQPLATNSSMAVY